jgi:pyruvate/2-oxoglutarate dehydrogenase complex dihydrolipoamide acyltransferase (E2) component
VTLAAPVHGVVVAIEVVTGDAVAAGQTLALLESMKMEVPVVAPCAGVVHSVDVAVGDVAALDVPVLRLQATSAAPGSPMTRAPEGEAPRSTWLAWKERRRQLDDAARPEAVAARHAAGGRTARENVADLLDPGSFTEYGALAVAAQRSRRTL